MLNYGKTNAMLTAKNRLFSILLLSLLWVSGAHSANEDSQYFLQKIAQVPPVEQHNNQWLLPLEQPGNSKHYFLANKQGQIYQLGQDTPENLSPLLDLPALSVNNPIVELNAFTLHPNFSLRGQIGFATFYTAHIEKATSNEKTKRLLDPTVSLALPFDAVITEWQLDLAKTVDQSSQREVLRIAIPTLASGIKQLKFNPHSKSWHDDYAQLYISLPQSLPLKEYPLYSGAILRIHPEKNAGQNYTVSHNNPYYANDDINKTLYLFGAGQINQFIWPDKHAPRLLISHEYNVKKPPTHWLSYSNGGDDWRNKSPQNFLFKGEQATSGLVIYQGRNALSLRNKLLWLSQNKQQQWQLNSLPNEMTPDPLSKSNEQAQQPLVTPSIEWQLTQPTLQTKRLTLYHDNRDEVLLFNEESGAIYQLFEDKTLLTPQGNNQENEQSGLGIIATLLIIIVGGVGLYIIYRVNIKRTSAKSLVRREFSNLSLTEDGLTLNLFKRHQRDIEKTMMLTEVKQCQVLLGDLAVATINTTSGHGFNTDKEQALREIFHREQVAKMVDDKVRRISLSITCEEKNRSVICLYLRKGNDRITKKNYFTVVDDIIDWCWLIAKAINEDSTQERPLMPKIQVTNTHLNEHKVHDNRPLHAQVSHSRPERILPAIKPKQNTSAAPAEKPKDKEISANHYDSAAIEAAKIETELVNALEKLVKLRQQGFLTADEFEQAKAKLYHFH